LTTESRFCSKNEIFLLKGDKDMSREHNGVWKPDTWQLIFCLVICWIWFFGLPTTNHTSQPEVDQQRINEIRKAARETHRQILKDRRELEKELRGW